MTDAADPALAALLDQIARARGFGCDAYKDSCVRRRLAVRMRARGVHTYDEYARLLAQDETEYERLLDTLTINVSKFYRNPETWDALRAHHLPPLWDARQGAVRCWSAGCASGEEPYTLAIVLLEHARAAGWSTTVPSLIDATDFDRGSLARAEAGSYPESAFEEMPPSLLDRHFSASPPRLISAGVRALVRFRRHDLLGEPPPGPPYDLILCRNVVIYFDRSIQERLFLMFADALAPDGILVLGKVETLFGGARERLTLDNARERIYRRAS